MFETFWQCKNYGELDDQRLPIWGKATVVYNLSGFVGITAKYIGILPQIKVFFTLAMK